MTNFNQIYPLQLLEYIKKKDFGNSKSKKKKTKKRTPKIPKT